MRSFTSGDTELTLVSRRGVDVRKPLLCKDALVELEQKRDPCSADRCGLSAIVSRKQRRHA